MKTTKQDRIEARLNEPLPWPTDYFGHRPAYSTSPIGEHRKHVKQTSVQSTTNGQRQRRAKP